MVLPILSSTQLYKHTDLQTSYGINNVAIVKGQTTNTEPERHDQ